MNALIAISGFERSSSTAYTPCFLIAGRTSDVTQCLNLLADSNLLPKIKAYKPDSLMTVTSLL
nr:MAG TPA: hypothetical protein [Caudoviricetes sp.]